MPTTKPTQLPDITQIRKPTEFVSSLDYREFDTDLRTLFQVAVDNEFLALEEKAGLSVAVYTDKKLWTYATVKADNNVKMMVDTPLMVSSTSKTFLSALILSQIEMSLYELTDSLGTGLENHPDFPSFELDKVNPEVTIEEILTMSSGKEARIALANYYGQPFIKEVLHFQGEFGPGYKVFDAVSADGSIVAEVKNVKWDQAQLDGIQFDLKYLSFLKRFEIKLMILTNLPTYQQFTRDNAVLIVPIGVCFFPSLHRHPNVSLMGIDAQHKFGIKSLERRIFQSGVGSPLRVLSHIQPNTIRR